MLSGKFDTAVAVLIQKLRHPVCEGAGLVGSEFTYFWKSEWIAIKREIKMLALELEQRKQTPPVLQLNDKLDPRQELQLARTALKLGWPLDVEAIIDMAEKALDECDIENCRKEYDRGYDRGYDDAKID